MKDDEFKDEDLDDEKTIAFIRERLPQDLKNKYSDDDFFFILDTLYDYYEHSGILDASPDKEGYIDIDIEAIARYIAAEAKKNKIGTYDPEELFFVVEGELAYNGVLDDEPEE